jgi:hypothetical protein
VWPLGSRPAGRSHPRRDHGPAEDARRTFPLSVLRLSQEVRAAAEGKGSFVDFELPGGDGRSVMFFTAPLDRRLRPLSKLDRR